MYEGERSEKATPLEFRNLAAEEHDPERLRELAAEINRLFEAQQTEKNKKPVEDKPINHADPHR